MNTTNILTELYKIYDAINDEYFESSLPTIFITIKQGKSKSKNVYGTFTPNSWAHKDGEETDSEGMTKEIINENRIHEIAMSGEYLSRPFANMCATLCHEMVHLYCQINEIEDTSNGGVYHNNKFKKEAEKRGLIIEKAKIIGWSVTTPSADFIEFVSTIDDIDDSVFAYFRETPMEISKVTQKKRWICPICGQKASAKKDANIGCWECMLPMDYWDITEEGNEQILEDRNGGLALTDDGWWGKEYN